MPAGADPGPDALLDTSVAVALLVSDHESHAATAEATHGMRLGLAGHAWFETYSVITRMPPGARRGPAVVRALLDRNFPGAWFLDAPATATLTAELARLGIAGGAVYDALVGAAARHHGVQLLTHDARALRTYAALGVQAALIPSSSPSDPVPPAGGQAIARTDAQPASRHRPRVVRSRRRRHP